ncbi:MAG: hypothetical protein J0L58_01505 [Burkholderiales bacterium]|nr:hypothetical protein [Burkholderiales bacterium]
MKHDRLGHRRALLTTTAAMLLAASRSASATPTERALFARMEVMTMEQSCKWSGSIQPPKLHNRRRYSSNWLRNCGLRTPAVMLVHLW